MSHSCIVIKNNLIPCGKPAQKGTCFCRQHRFCIASTIKGKKCCKKAGPDRLCTHHRNMGKKAGCVVHSKEYKNILFKVNNIQRFLLPIVRKSLSDKRKKLLTLWKSQHLNYRKEYLKYFINNSCTIPTFECNLCFSNIRKRMPSCIDNEYIFPCGRHSICRSCAIQMAYKGMNFCPFCRSKSKTGFEIAPLSTEGSFAILKINDILVPFVKKRLYLNNRVELTNDKKPTYKWNHGEPMLFPTIICNLHCYVTLIHGSIGEREFIASESNRNKFAKMYMDDCFIERVDDINSTLIVKEEPDIKRVLCGFAQNGVSVSVTSEQACMFRSMFGTDAYLLESEFSVVLTEDVDEDFTYRCSLTPLWTPFSLSNNFYLSEMEYSTSLSHDYFCKIRNEDGYISRTKYVDDLQFILNVSMNIERYRTIFPVDIETKWSSYYHIFYMLNPDIQECNILNEVTINTEIKWVPTIPV